MKCCRVLTKEISCPFTSHTPAPGQSSSPQVGHPGQGKRETGRSHTFQMASGNSIRSTPKFTFPTWNPTSLKTWAVLEATSTLKSIIQSDVQRSDTFLPKCHLLRYTFTWHTDNQMLHLLLELLFHLYHLNNTECHVCFTNCQFRLPKYTVFSPFPLARS